MFFSPFLYIKFPFSPAYLEHHYMLIFVRNLIISKSSASLLLTGIYIHTTAYHFNKTLCVKVRKRSNKTSVQSSGVARYEIKSEFVCLLPCVGEVDVSRLIEGVVVFVSVIILFNWGEILERKVWVGETLEKKFFVVWVI